MSNENWSPKKHTESTSCDSCIHSRRCFMSGEYCSKQLNIYQERKKLHAAHDKRQINAFVVMNFSDMSDVVYKWRLKDFVRSLSRNLYINKKTEAVICSLEDPGAEWAQVEQINVLRADSSPASNHVICNQVCQQMQIADLVIVDVTVENTNVFYEFGMAVALDKLILPICYNDSFYRPKPPKNNIEFESSTSGKQKLEKHIDCFPWRRRLFEYFGLRYRNSDSIVQYFPYAVAVDDLMEKQNGQDVPNRHGNEFTDNRYKKFPYHQEVEFRTGADTPNQKQKIGQAIYEALANSYNAPEKQALNTLVIYTMDGFTNDSEAAQCIINFYEHMTAQVRKMHCFCGDRVVTLIQENAVGDDNKDAKEKAYLPYKVGDLIHIGMNQATYMAQRDKIVTSDFLSPPDMEISESEREDLVTAVKTHIGNKSMMIPLSPPIYVEQVKSGLQQGIFAMDDPAHLDKYFCFFHIMLRTLQYANEIVVDISNNCIEALFWLGMAHGADIHAITVRYDRSETELALNPDDANKKERNIFDVTGLWTAVLKAHDTEIFYHQLALAQTSIEQHSKLMLKNADLYAEAMLDILREAPYTTTTKRDIDSLLKKKKADEESKLESYYRDRFWSRMIRQNRLHLYMPQKPDKDKKHQLMLAKWDVDAISALSHYLSKRKVISESYIEALNQTDPSETPTNFISIGADASPYADANATPITLAQHINEQFSKTESGKQHVRVLNSSIGGLNRETKCRCSLDSTMDNIRCRGFLPADGSDAKPLFALLPDAECYGCSKAVMDTSPEAIVPPIHSEAREHVDQCPFPKIAGKEPRHFQLGQMILWREYPKDGNGSIKFQVSLSGASGPASYALSSLLVDRYQKQTIIHWEKDVEQSPHLLSALQTKIRTDFLGKYTKSLDNIVGNKILQHIKMYLSTVLYRYFFPFLSEEDEHRICNGLTAYLTATKPENADFIPEVVKKLRALLTSFRGVEAMYLVEVEVLSSSTDNRTIRDIIPISSQDPQLEDISCIYF